MNKETFMNQLVEYHESRGMVFDPPKLLGYSIDLFEMFIASMRQGGFPRVNKNSKWSHIARTLGIIPADKSLNSVDQEQIKKFYVKWIRGFEGDCVSSSVKNQLMPIGMEIPMKRKRDNVNLNEPCNFQNSSFNRYGNQINSKKQLQEFPSSFQGVLPNIWRIALSIRNRNYAPEDFIFCLNCLYLSSHPNGKGLLIAEYPTILNLLTDVICELLYDLLYPSYSPLNINYKQALELLSKILPTPPSDVPPPSSSLLLSHPPSPPPPSSPLAVNSSHHAIYLCSSIISNILHLEANRIFLSGTYPAQIKKYQKFCIPPQPPTQQDPSQLLADHLTLSSQHQNNFGWLHDTSNKADISVKKGHKASPENELRSMTSIPEVSHSFKPQLNIQNLLADQQLSQKGDLIHSSISSSFTSALGILKMTCEPLSILEERLNYFVNLGRYKAKLAVENPFEGTQLYKTATKQDLIPSESASSLQQSQPIKPNNRLLHPNFKPISPVGCLLFGNSNDEPDSTLEMNTTQDHTCLNTEVILPNSTEENINLQCFPKTSSSLSLQDNQTPIYSHPSYKFNTANQSNSPTSKQSFQHPCMSTTSPLITKSMSPSAQTPHPVKSTVQKIASLALKSVSFKTQITSEIPTSFKTNYLQLSSAFQSTRSAARQEELELTIQSKLEQISDETHSFYTLINEQAEPYLEMSLTALNCLVFLIGLVERTTWWIDHASENVCKFLETLQKSSNFIPGIFKSQIGFSILQNILELCSQVLLYKKEALLIHFPLLLSLCSEILEFYISNCDVQLSESLIRSCLNLIHLSCRVIPNEILLKGTNDQKMSPKGAPQNLCDLFLPSLIRFLYNNLKIYIVIIKKCAISDAFESLWSKPDYIKAFNRFESNENITNSFVHSKIRKRMSTSAEILNTLGAIPINLQVGEDCFVNFQTKFASEKKEPQIVVMPPEVPTSIIRLKSCQSQHFEETPRSYISQLVSSSPFRATTSVAAYPSFSKKDTLPEAKLSDNALGVTKALGVLPQESNLKPRYEPSVDQWRENFYKDSVLENIETQKFINDAYSQLLEYENEIQLPTTTQGQSNANNFSRSSNRDELEVFSIPRQLQLEVQHMAEIPSDEESYPDGHLLNKNEMVSPTKSHQEFYKPLDSNSLNFEASSNLDFMDNKKSANNSYPMVGMFEGYPPLTKENKIALECLLILAADKDLVQVLQPYLPSIIEMAFLPTSACNSLWSIISNLKSSYVLNANSLFKSHFTQHNIPKAVSSLSNEIIRIEKIQ